MSRFAQQLSNGQIQFAAGGIDSRDHDHYLITDADFRAGALAADDAVFVVHIPPVIHQVFVANQAVDQVGLQLDEHTEIGDTGDYAGEFFTDVVLQQFQQFHLPKFALGIVAAAFGETQMLAQLDQLIESGRIIQRRFFSCAFSAAGMFGFVAGGKIAVEQAMDR